MLTDPQGYLGAGVEVKLGQDVMDVDPHGGHADCQLLGNLSRRQSARQQFCHLHLPRRKQRTGCLVSGSQRAARQPVLRWSPPA